jgi:putative transposase
MLSHFVFPLVCNCLDRFQKDNRMAQHFEPSTIYRRNVTPPLEDRGHRVNRKRVQRLMRTMGLVAVYPKRNLSLANQAHKVYPYLLRGLTIDRPNQVWATDITFVPMARGFVYLVAIMDW